MSLNESHVEDAALEWFGELGYTVGHGPHLAPGEPAAERDSFGEVVLVGRLRAALRRLNPALPEEAREEALRKVLRVGTPALVQTNRAFHRMLRDGIPVDFIQPEPSPRPSPSGRGRSEAEGEGQRRWDIVRLIDFDDVRANDFFAVNQFTVIEGQHNRRPDIVVFINGLPLGLIELKNAADEDATIWSAYAQLQTYKAEIPTLLHYNAALVVSDGLQARMGSVTANQEWFKVWRTIDGQRDAAPGSLELETLIRGVFERQRFLDLLHHFIVFEEDPDSGALHKIIAGYHQFHAVNAAVEETVRASGMAETGIEQREDAGTYWAGRQRGGKPGDRRAGVVWHTQGSGKSFSMLFFAARVVRHPAMQNPTLVVLTDRNDLDDQLFGQFQRCADILGQSPVQASGREHLRELLNRASGGVVFTTIHKFMPEKGEAMPELSARQNIVVIADEAHRSQYGFGGKVNEKTGEMSYGFASNLRDALPNASFIGFTGTPIEKTDANTRAVFGDYISIYDIQRAVADKATVPIYYESRISKLALNAAELPKLDAEFEEITEGEELTKKEKLKTKWAALEALVGDPKRIALVAADLVAHFDKRVEAMDGKAMIVCMSRRICVDLYNALIKLRPEWEAETLKVVMTGSAEDGPEWQKHIGNKQRRRELANQFKDAKNPLKIVIVRDMWLTGFDAPCLHTMYADKPMQGHRPREPRVPRQTGRASGGLPRPRRSAQEGARDLHRERRPGEPDLRHRPSHRRDAGEARHRLRHDAWFLMEEVDQRHADRAPATHPRRTGTHPRTGRRQEALGAGGDGAFPRLRPVRRQRRSHGDPGRRFLFPSPASRAQQTEQPEPEDARADRRRHPPAREQGHHHLRPGDRRLHRRRIAQAGHQHSIRPVPRRSARAQAQERRRRVAGEAAQERTQGALQAQPRAEPGLQ